MPILLRGGSTLARCRPLWLALAAASVYALWNLLPARARDPEAATAVVLLVATAAFAPIAVMTWDVDPFRAARVAGSVLVAAGVAALALSG